MLKVVERPDAKEAGAEHLLLDEIARAGAQRMLMAALRAEADAYVERHRAERDPKGRALVVRNGRAASRKVTLGERTVEVRALRVDDRRGDEHGKRRRFTSQILPPYMRRSLKVAEVLPILYLRGLSTGDFRPALKCPSRRGRGRAVADQHRASDRRLGERVSGVSPARACRPQVRVRVGRWGALQYPARRSGWWFSTPCASIRGCVSIMSAFGPRANQARSRLSRR